MMTHIVRILFCSCLCSSAIALPTDAEQDLMLESETLEYNQVEGTITYSGSVLMSQGSMRIEADKVVIHGNMERATKVSATGKPARFQQTPEIGAIPVKASADSLDYRVADKSLMLEGNASLKQEGTSLSGNRIEYDVKRAIVKAESQETGSNEKNRVRMVIPPKALQPDAK